MGKITPSNFHELRLRKQYRSSHADQTTWARPYPSRPDLVVQLNQPKNTPSINRMKDPKA